MRVRIVETPKYARKQIAVVKKPLDVRREPSSGQCSLHTLRQAIKVVGPSSAQPVNVILCFPLFKLSSSSC